MIISQILKGLARQRIDLSSSLVLQPRLLLHLVLPLDMSEEPGGAAHRHQVHAQAEAVAQEEPWRVPVDLGGDHAEALDDNVRSSDGGGPLRVAAVHGEHPSDHDDETRIRTAGDETGPCDQRDGVRRGEEDHKARCADTEQHDRHQSLASHPVGHVGEDKQADDGKRVRDDGDQLGLESSKTEFSNERGKEDGEGADPDSSRSQHDRCHVELRVLQGKDE